MDCICAYFGIHILNYFPFRMWTHRHTDKYAHTYSDATDQPTALLHLALVIIIVVTIARLTKIIWEQAALAPLVTDALIHQCLSRPSAPPQTTYATVHTLLDSYAANFWLGAPHSPPKLLLPVDQSPNPTTCLIPGPIQSTIPNRIHIQSAVLPQCTGQTDTHTHRPADSWK